MAQVILKHPISGATDQYLRFGTHVIRGLIYEKKKNCSHVQSTHSVVMASRGMKEFERPASFKSPVWGKEVSG